MIPYDLAPEPSSVSGILVLFIIVAIVVIVVAIIGVILMGRKNKQ